MFTILPPNQPVTKNQLIGKIHVQVQQYSTDIIYNLYVYDIISRLIIHETQRNNFEKDSLSCPIKFHLDMKIIFLHGKCLKFKKTNLEIGLVIDEF